MGGKRAAVLVGCNYGGTLAELKGCVNDVWAMHSTLCKRFHFDGAHIQVLVDNDPMLTMPTGANIRRALCTTIASMSSYDDMVFFHFSGHGIRLPPPNVRPSCKLAPSQYDECIVPCDMNLLTDEDIREVVDLLPKGVTLTIVADSCCSGGLIKYEKEQIGDSFTYVGDTSNSATGIEPTSKGVAKKRKRSIGVGSSRSLPISTFIEILQGRNEKKAINISDVRHSLVTMFKEESSIKFKNLLNVASKLVPTCSIDIGNENELQSTSCILESCCQKANSSSSFDLPKPCNVKLGKAPCEDNAILISACQAYESAQDVMPSYTTTKVEFGPLTKSPFGAMTYAILTVLSQLDPNQDITNYDLIMHARKLLADHGLTQQHPGLYCCDDYVKATFLSNKK
ncbi:hypothetical protein GOP47_0001527 [Adiantum capillus-veneris]|uniref:Peptidase C14 caspase domain-containing protein n=1 Tax=Adiantum capillus-veneris TaxID=13818 RepID=A0A9D4V945_ADICA|nr:hypothetical protein GOP47_0001527 [Adiantum capillus-veneris]